MSTQVSHDIVFFCMIVS